MTVSQLRHMVANTEVQCVYGYSACVREVNDFLSGIRYDDATRRRIVQHLSRRRPSLVSATTRRAPPTFAARRVPADAESTSGDNVADYDEHLRMFSYSSADSTTDGAAEPEEAGSTAVTVTNSNTGTSCKSEETTNSGPTVVSRNRGEDSILHNVESTDDAVPAVIDVHPITTDIDESGSHLEDDVVLSPVWRPW